MAALDTLYFDLKINDLTGEQMKAIKSRLSNELKMNLDIGKDIQRAIGNTNTNVHGILYTNYIVEFKCGVTS